MATMNEPPSGAARFACPCCGCLTIEWDVDDPPPGTYVICEVCGWEDDPLQFSEPNYRGGANQESLNECRAEFLAWRDAGFPPREDQRQPTADEIPSESR